MWGLWKQRRTYNWKLRCQVALLCIALGVAGMCRSFAVPREAPYAQVIQSLGDASNWQEALELLVDMCQLDPRAALNTETFTAAVLACGSAAQWLQVSLLLEEARRKKVKSDLGMSQAALAAYAEGLAWDEAVRLFREAESPPDLFPTVVELCARAQQAEVATELLAEVMSACGGGRNQLAGDEVIDPRRSVQALRLLWLAINQWGVGPDVRLYRTGLGMCTARLWAAAVFLLSDMEAQGFVPSVADLNAVIQAIAAAQEEAHQGKTQQEKKEISQLNVKRARTAAPAQEPRNPKLNFPPVVVDSRSAGPEKTPSLGSRAGAATQTGFNDILADQHMRKNLPWNGGGPWGKWQMTLSLLEKMQLSDLSPEVATLNAIITACARAQELAPCKLLLDTMKGCALQPDTSTCDQLIGAFCRKGLWEQALLLVDRAKNLGLADISTLQEGLKACYRGRQPRLALLLLATMDRTAGSVSTSALNIAIATCAHHGLWKQAVALLSELHSRQMEPNSATYAAVAAACSAGPKPPPAWERTLLLLEESQRLGLDDRETYASAIACCDRWELVLSALVAMRAAMVPPAARTYSDVLRTFTDTTLASAAVELLEAPLKKELPD